MEDRQVRIKQRGPVQVSTVPVEFTVKKGGVDVVTEGFVVVVNSGGLSFVKGVLELTSPPATGTWTIEVPYLANFTPQVFGTMGQSGSATEGTFARISAGVITPVAALPTPADGDYLTIQGVL